MKKSMRTIACMALASIALTACNNQTSKVDEAPAATKTTTEGVKIAYVEVDSIMTQYKFCKEYSAILEKKSQNIQNTVNAKGRALQNAAAKVQQDIQSNKYTQQQAQQIQASLQKQAQDADGLQQRLGAEYQSEVAKYNKALSDSIHNYLNVFNKDKKYAMILAKQGDNILYADKANDITDVVVKGLNKAYKGMKK